MSTSLWQFSSRDSGPYLTNKRRYYCRFRCKNQRQAARLIYEPCLWSIPLYKWATDDECDGWKQSAFKYHTLLCIHAPVSPTSWLESDVTWPRGETKLKWKLAQKQVAELNSNLEIGMNGSVTGGVCVWYMRATVANHLYAMCMCVHMKSKASPIDRTASCRWHWTRNVMLLCKPLNYWHSSFSEYPPQSIYQSIYW